MVLIRCVVRKMPDGEGETIESIYDLIGRLLKEMLRLRVARSALCDAFLWLRTRARPNSLLHRGSLEAALTLECLAH